MQRCQLDEQALALFENVHLHLATVPFARAPLNEPPCLAARNERHHSMWLGLQAFRELADMRVVASGVPLDVQEHQILERRNAVRSSASLREPLESAHLIAKFRQLLKRCLGQYCVPAGSSHRSSVQFQLI